MFRTIGDGPSLWESRLPAEVLRLPAELARVDALLDDPAFFAPFAPFFHPVPGRPSTPAECYLRLMFLKFRYRLGYESLCAEVSDSISWRLGKPVEFGYKAQVTDNDDGIILDHVLEQGNPADGPQLAPPSAESSGGRAASPGPLPPTAATARNPSKMTCTTSESATW
jgi:IS5 family transposase